MHYACCGAYIVLCSVENAASWIDKRCGALQTIALQWKASRLTYILKVYYFLHI